jgi:hypothetical protein
MRPGYTFGSYRHFTMGKTHVTFRPDSRVLSDAEVAEMVRRFDGVARQVISSSGRIEVAAPGPCIARVSLGLVDIDLLEPKDLTAHGTSTVMDSYGSLTLVLEIRDGYTAEPLLRYGRRRRLEGGLATRRPRRAHRADDHARISRAASSTTSSARCLASRARSRSAARSAPGPRRPSALADAQPTAAAELHRVVEALGLDLVALISCTPTSRSLTVRLSRRVTSASHSMQMVLPRVQTLRLPLRAGLHLLPALELVLEARDAARHVARGLRTRRRRCRTRAAGTPRGSSRGRSAAPAPRCRRPRASSPRARRSSPRRTAFFFAAFFFLAFAMSRPPPSYRRLAQSTPGKERRERVESQQPPRGR